MGLRSLNMDFAAFFNSDIFTWGILPVLIFISRIFDVSLGTIRIIFVSRGKKYLAPLLGFFEVMIWLLAISQIMKHLDNFLCYIAYGAGFAMGNFIGIMLEEKLALGILAVRIILVRDECRIKERLIAEGYGVTVVDAKGANSDVSIIYTIIKRKDLDDVIAIINKCNSRAFYTVEDARTVYRGVFPDKDGHAKQHGLGFLRINRLFGADRKRK